MPETTNLPVAGYTPQSEDRITLVNQNKVMEETILRQIDFIASLNGVDQRWVAIARTQIQQGFMDLNRAVFQPQRLSDEDLAKLKGGA